MNSAVQRKRLSRVSLLRKKSPKKLLEIKEKEREREKEAAAAVKLAEAPKPVIKPAPEPAAPRKKTKTQEEKLEADHDITDTDEVLVKRPPIITVMGHVNHGKTSLLDAIKKTNIASGEAGGITQHIGAYSVICKGEKITFLDTPGHEAFAEMRARGAKVTDIAVLVVAADDGIMPQTIEAVNHAKSANVPVILAVNKIDKAGANIDKIKQAITEYGLVPEDWGGDTMIVPLSAKTGEGVDKLLESILLLAEVNDYRANPSRKAKGSVIEAKLDKGDIVVSGTAIGKVRAMTDDKGRSIKEAPPSTPVSVLGLTEVPNAGDIIMVVSDEKSAKQVVAERTAKIKNDQMVSNQKTTLDDVFNKIQEGKIKDLNVIIKADVQGSVEALKNSLAKITNEEARVNIVAGSVGAINKSDIMIAEVSKSIIIGFNVRPDAETKTLAESAGIEICLYKVIYEAIEELERRLSGMIAPKTREVITGRAQVRNVFKITGAGIIAGSYVTNGKIYRGSHARVYRGGELVFNGQINGLKRFKDDVKEVAENYECGISIDNFSDIKELDEIEAYTIEISGKIKRRNAAQYRRYYPQQAERPQSYRNGKRIKGRRCQGFKNRKGQLSIDKESALCLFCGLSTDTGHFMHSNTDTAVLKSAAFLTELGVNVNETASLLYRNNTVEKQAYRPRDKLDAVFS
ncbi:translation initiation factor if-2-related [Holotrichia oblita]|nr:translation initiation factor if-2-related [Holotrichia oblita]